jgi:endonuclease/exonuclease/phosphatase family metal-dependent hydrolase
VKLLDWNIQKINATTPRSLRGTLAAIDEINPDAMALQEVGDGIRTVLLQALATRGYIPVTSDSPPKVKGHQVLVAARAALIDEKSRTYIHPTYPRAIVGAEIGGGAKRCTLLSFHVPNGANQGWRKADCMNALADMAAANPPNRTMLFAGDANEPASYRPDGSAIPYVSSRERLRFNGAGRVLSTTKPWRDTRGESRPANQWYEAIERVFPSGPERSFTELCLPYHLTPGAEPSHRTRGVPKPLDHLLCVGPQPKVLRLDYLHHLRNSHTKGAPSDHSALLAELDF